MDDSAGDGVSLSNGSRSESPRRRVRYNIEAEEPSSKLTSIWSLLFAFCVASLPLLVIAIILLVFAFQTKNREEPTNEASAKILPVQQQHLSGFYWTDRSTGSFLLVASWASNVASVVTAPFMIIYSYIIARAIVHESETGECAEKERPRFLNSILRGGRAGLYAWGRQMFLRKKQQALQQSARRLGVVNVAGLGLLTACILTLLVVIGDNWLHTTTSSKSFIWYSPILNFSELPDYDFKDYWINPSIQINGSLCDRYSNNESRIPCSLNQTDNGSVDLMKPEYVYSTLLEGISQQNTSLNTVNFTELNQDQTSTNFEITTFFKNESYHSIFFSASSAAEFPNVNETLDLGIDFVAQTFSMSTQCSIITSDCNLTALTNSSKAIDQNNLNIPFNCYNYFAGNLGQTPLNGHEKAQGWNTSFYSLENGTPQNISVEKQLNPFPFYVVAAVNSLSPDTYNDLNNGTVNNDLVIVEGGLIAFALSCTATVYDVSYSLVNGSLIELNATIADPAIAAIIKAPLQVGFGSYHLFEQAQGAVLSYDPTDPQAFPEMMANALSQTGMALASGPFTYEEQSDNKTQVRIHYKWYATAVHKDAFWFLVISSLLYAAVLTVLTIIAFLLRRNEKIKNQQEQLMASVGRGHALKLGDFNDGASQAS